MYYSIDWDPDAFYLLSEELEVYSELWSSLQGCFCISPTHILDPQITSDLSAKTRKLSEIRESGQSQIEQTHHNQFKPNTRLA